MFEKEAEEAIMKKYPSSVQGYKSLIKNWKDGAEFGYNKCKEELNRNGLALQSDMDKTIEQNIALKKELNKANEWHKVTEKLPEHENLVCNQDGEPCWYDSETDQWLDIEGTRTKTAEWCDMPHKESE